MDRGRLLQIIVYAMRGAWTKLDLSEKGITEPPPEIGQLQNLHTLNLSGNQLTGLPPEIGQLQNLQELNLNNNRLRSLPPEIGQLHNLHTLYLNNNQLTGLPPEIGQLTGLQTLSLGRNRLRRLPPEIGQLQNLQELNLNNNQLTGLPPESDQLTGLQMLSLGRNRLRRLPPEIGQLQNLQWLYLYSNQLTGLPPGIGQLTNLQGLGLGGNRLTSLPPEIGQLHDLQRLDLLHNQLTGLPPEIQHLTQLEMLDLRDNPNLGIPEEIVGIDIFRLGNPQTILEYYFSRFRRPINELKVILVGQERAGKTSLVNRLVYQSFDGAQSSTRGINIDRWSLPVNEHDVRLNLWDFGGQVIMHSTHQFFLTRRTLYLLVLDATRDAAANRVGYWLNMIKSTAGEGVPVIVVQNKIDEWGSGTNILTQPFLGKFPQIKGVVNTSCKTGDGIEQLAAGMAEVIATIGRVHDEWPVEWLNIKQALEVLKSEQDIIDYRDYRDICLENGVDDPDVQTGLLRILHELGVVLSFVDDLRLADQNVLKPEWVTDGVYKIITAQAVRKSKGMLDVRKHLPTILTPPRYERPHHRFILDMLEKFRVAFRDPANPNHYLIPALLSEEGLPNPPADKVDALAFAYQYPDILPPHIMSQLIVYTRSLSTHCWRSGVRLENNGNTALVKADRERGWVRIWVTGKPYTRKNLLLKIRAYLDLIHATMPGLKPQANVLVKGHPVKYSFLLRQLENGITMYDLPDIGEFNIPQVVEGVAWPQEKATGQVQNVYHIQGDLVMQDKITMRTTIVGNIDSSENIVIGDEGRVA